MHIISTRIVLLQDSRRRLVG